MLEAGCGETMWCDGRSQRKRTIGVGWRTGTGADYRTVEGRCRWGRRVGHLDPGVGQNRALRRLAVVCRNGNGLGAAVSFDDGAVVEMFVGVVDTVAIL